MFSSTVLRAAGVDYTCSTVNRIYVCVPRTQAALERFQKLQAVIQLVTQAMVTSGYKEFPFNVREVKVDGRPGPTTTIATKFVVARFAAAVPPPPQVAALLDPGLDEKQGIDIVAQNADYITSYIATTFRDHPEALRNDPVVIVKSPTRMRLTAEIVPLMSGATMIVGAITQRIIKGYWG